MILSAGRGASYTVEPPWASQYATASTVAGRARFPALPRFERTGSISASRLRTMSYEAVVDKRAPLTKVFWYSAAVCTPRQSGGRRRRTRSLMA
jgi:hypothetical protein